MGDLLWPTYDGPDDLAAIEAVPLADRGLPGTTYELLVRAAALWPDRRRPVRAARRRRWQQPAERTYAAAARRRPPLRQRAPRARRAARRRGRPAGARTATSWSPRRWPPAGGHRRADQRRARPGSTSPSCCAGPAPGCWSPPGPTSPRRCGSAARELAAEAGMEALLVLRPTGAGPAPVELQPVDGVRVALPVRAGRRSSHPTPSRVTPPSAADLAALFHTGGTTGTPKLAAHTHANEVSDAWMIAANGLLHDGRGGVRRAAAVPRQRARRHRCWRPLFRGLEVVWAGPPGLPRPGAVRALLEARRALPGRRDERGAHRVRRPRRAPGRRRHQQPALRRRRRVAAAAGGPGRLRVRHRHPAGRGLRPHRGHLRQRARASPTIRGPARSASACPTSR